MKKIMVIAVLLALAGCSCPECFGEVVNATSCIEFKVLVKDLARNDPDGLADLLMQVATGAVSPASQDAVLTINTAQNNRWFNLTGNSSFMADGYWMLGRQAINRNRPLTAFSWMRYTGEINKRVSDPTKKQRLLDKVDMIANPTYEE